MSLMNRIILVGNGFDVAHDLPTRYEDFVNWYWKRWGERLLCSSKKLEEDELYSFQLKLELGGWYLVWGYYYNRIKIEEISQIVDLLKKDYDVCEFKGKSLFFDKICKSIQEKKWVDIEDEYYKLLCSFLKEKPKYEKPKILNDELGFVKSKLIEYLTSIQDTLIERVSLNDNIKKKICSPFVLSDISVSSRDTLQNFINRRIKLPPSDWSNLLNDYGKNDISSRLDKIEFFKCAYDKFLKLTARTGIVPDQEVPEDFLLPDRIMLLNFNYTKTADKYLSINHRFIVNHIHGELSKPENIIFGHGDELDESYKELQKLNDNEYLRNIKTIRYQETDNYRQMLSFIEDAPYQVCIMGHSCGNSDRTLLNTLFEHKNCVSIKPFYHQKEDGSDNYLDLIQNICRNFTDMKLMRDRVVNKTFCTSLS